MQEEDQMYAHLRDHENDQRYIGRWRRMKICKVMGTIKPSDQRGRHDTSHRSCITPVRRSRIQPGYALFHPYSCYGVPVSALC